MHTYRKKTIKALIVFLILFFAAFLLGFYYLKTNEPIFNIGLPAQAINWIVVILSILFILRVLIEIGRVEHAKPYEKRVKSQESFKNF